MCSDSGSYLVDPGKTTSFGGDPTLEAFLMASKFKGHVCPEVTPEGMSHRFKPHFPRLLKLLVYPLLLSLKLQAKPKTGLTKTPPYSAD